MRPFAAERPVLTDELSRTIRPNAHIPHAVVQHGDMDSPYRFAALALVSSLVVGTGWAGSVSAQAVATHRVVARVDVDGDGRTDVVRLRRVEDQHAVLTVSTARGATLSRHLRTTWIDPMWHGAARIDGRPGAELVLITDAGAHTLFHTVLTFRDGRLVRQHAPGRGRTWVTDGAAFVNIGWKRYRKDGRAFVAKRWVTEDYESPGWSGKSVTYRWGRGEWHRVATRSLRPRTDRKAARFGGWVVRGLPRYP